MKPIKKDPTTVMCASWCGRGCTKAEHDAALKIAHQTTKRLGVGWEPVVTHNMGWYPQASFRKKPLYVTIREFRGKRSYTAFFGDGRWTQNSRTPRAAVQCVISQARREMDRIADLLEEVHGEVSA